MKRLFFLSVLCCLFSLTASAQSQSTGKHNGHEWVDLGLSVKWAKCNIGASASSDYGTYFAWGETAPKSSYTEDNSMTKHKQLADLSGDKKYDAARANWGGEWRIPTVDECLELIEKCTWTWTTQDGHVGYKVTSLANGESIFLPAVATVMLCTMMAFVGSTGARRQSILMIIPSLWQVLYALLLMIRAHTFVHAL